MALTATFLAASPNAIRYTVTGNADDRASISAATLIAACAAGPLKSWLSKADTSGDTAWGNLGKTDLNVSVITGGGVALFAASAAVAAAASLDASSPGVRGLNFIVTHTGVLPCIIEIRSNHSLVK